MGVSPLYTIHQYNEQIYKVVAFKCVRDPDRMHVFNKEEAQHYDTIVIIICAYPVETVQGDHGGVRVEEWFHLDRRALNFDEVTFLCRLESRLDGADSEMLGRIIATFAELFSVVTTI